MQHNEQQALPQPESDSLEHSHAVAGFIRARMAEQGGSISFAEFMQHALYAPALGYYVAGATKFGAAGDFITAPEVSPVFGRVVARQCAEVLGGGGDVLELGAGSGRLAVDVLRTLQQLDALPRCYYIVEVSADLQERQQRLIESEIPGMASRVSWQSKLPSDMQGVILANEVIDAMPVERFRCRDGGLEQQRVTSSEGGFEFVYAAAPAKLVSAVKAIERSLGCQLPEGFVSEISLATTDWVRSLAGSLSLGIAFLFDYGVSRREYYAADRGSGWLRCHFRHRAHDDPLIYPGIQDITAWVDFTAVADAAIDAGFDVAGYTTQSRFLLDGGLERELQSFTALSTQAQLELSAQVKILTMPGEMGERFKCMALRRGDAAVPSAFRLADRTHAL